MTKATPGPWTLCRETFNGEVIGFHISASPHGSTKPICECRDGKAIEANGLLIAAAPDLLMAAKIVLQGLNLRIDEAACAGKPVPVFAGIADLHDAIGKAELT